MNLQVDQGKPGRGLLQRVHPEGQEPEGVGDSCLDLSRFGVSEFRRLGL